jgi:carboxyl-terminal processing protease
MRIAGAICESIIMTKSSKNIFLFTILVAIWITVAFFAGYATRALHPSNDELPLLNEAYSLLGDHALNPLPTSPAMEYGMIRGMVQAYGDPHTTFAEPPQAELEMNSLEGKFGGIGVRLGTDPQGYYILYPYPDGPAIEAGIKEGDRLLMVDKLEVTPSTPIDSISAAVRGPVGERVTLKVGRPPDYTPLVITIKREEIALPSVTWHLDAGEPRLGVLEVNIIAETTPNEIQRAVNDLKGRSAMAFALDLRNNGGGLLEEGINIARLFLRDGIIIEEQYRGQDVTSYRVEKVGSLADIPLVVLVNENTASAAEIIAGSIQAHQRGKLIGSQTYGKNTIQMVFELRDHSSLRVTAAHWWIPGLDFPKDGHGLQPDIPIPADEAGGSDPVIAAAILALFAP